MNHSLEHILSTSRDTMQKLLDTLMLETEVLEKNDIEELERVTLEKLALTDAVETNEKQRASFLLEHSLNPLEPEQWINTGVLKTLWQEIKEISSKCQRQNQVNGLVINSNRRRVKAQLEILNASPSLELIYSASGETVNPGNSKKLAQV